MARIYGPGPGEPDPLRPVPDLRGTPVDDVAGRPAGEVFGALTDAEGGLIRYIDLELYDSDRHVLVPIGHTTLERELGEPRVKLRAAAREDLWEIPPFDEDDEPLDHTSVLSAHGKLFYGKRYYAHPAFDHSALYAGEHPIVHGETTPQEPLPLAPLSDLPGYDIREGAPDIRGWPVMDQAGHRVGEVRELVVHTEDAAVYYVVLVLEGGAKEVLLPVGYLEIDRPGERIRTPALEAADIRALPGYRAGPITRMLEDEIRTTLDERLSGPRRFQRPDFAARSWTSDEGSA